MRDYLTFESEFDRLKDYFLLEGVTGNDDDLEEGTNNEKPETSDDSSTGDDAGEPGKNPVEAGKSDDTGNLADLDGDSDLDEITGNPGDAPSAEGVNKEDGAPGAINPENLLKELAEGEDNVYTRVAKAMQEKFPAGCSVKDVKVPLEQATAHAVKAFMKNRNYAPLSKEAMKGVCDNIADTILKKCAGKKPNPGPRQSPAANEAVYYVKKAPVFESEEIMEGALKNIALAGAIGLGAAGGANAATAESAPYATKAPTPLYQEFQKNADTKADRKKADVKTDATGKDDVSGVPNAKDPSSVVFSGSRTYTLTPDEYMTYKMANNLPAHYTVTGGSEGSRAKGKTGGEPGREDSVKAGAGSATQAAVKSDTKSSVGHGGKSRGSSGERCAAPKEKESEGIGHTLHRWAHKAVDKGGEIGAGIIGGAVGAAKGLYHGANAGYSKAKDAIEKDHDKMIQARRK